MKYGFLKRINCDYESVLEKLSPALKNEGFGILTQIDVRNTLKNKLDVDFPKYMIVGVCNPSLAYRALQSEINIGLMLPCNIIIYEKDGDTYIALAKPSAAMAAVDNPALEKIVAEAESRLVKVFDSIS
ncbi:MAG: DUF302 domain-containing protein [candidate division Zixibacteria bacterium]|nr:DUF302 domain-containing protein [candidate division Zixibacteria bacterium]